MATKPRTKMPVEKRAKQFMPFSPLNGLSNAILAKERIVVAKSDLSEDHANELDSIFSRLHTGMMTTVTYFHKDEYLKLTGMIAKIDVENKFLQVVNTKIPLQDIYDITI